MIAGLSVLWVALFGAVICEDSDATLRFYHKDFNEFTELPITKADQIFETNWYNASRGTTVFTHGYTGHPNGLAVQAVIKVLLEQDQGNVILLNWKQMAANTQENIGSSYLNWAAPNARFLGYRFADTLRNLSAAGLDLQRTHLIGHSLGAQLFGITGNQLQHSGIQLPWIIGLDPAGAPFQGRPPPHRLHAGSAALVTVIHSDPSRYGIARSTGTVDFWPNFRNIGSVRQPGCDSGPHPMFSVEDLCNHDRAWKLLADSLQYPGTLLGSQARNYRTWKNYSWKERNAAVLDIGAFYKKVVPGNYYFVTRDASPYGLGRKGI